MLIELPVGKYFAQYLADQAETSAVLGAEEARSRLSEMPLAMLENSIIKLYLEDFHQWTQSLGGETAVQMDTLLGARADAITINVTYNSLSTAYNNVSHAIALSPSIAARHAPPCAARRAREQSARHVPRLWLAVP